MAFFDFTRTRSYRNVMAKVYGIGAAIVLIGALFKINHYMGADLALAVGLGTEAIVFFLSSFEPPHVDPDWSLVYPELAGMYHPVEGQKLPEATAKSSTSVKELDDMFKKAGIEQDVIDQLGKGLEKLSQTAGQLSDVTETASASKEFSTQLRSAAQSAGSLGEVIERDAQSLGQHAESMSSVNESTKVLNNAYVQAADALKNNMDSTEEFSSTVQEAIQSAKSMSESYHKSAEALAASVESFDFTSNESAAYNNELRKVTENLSALNALYEVQLKDSSAVMENSSKMKETVDQLYQSLQKSTELSGEFTNEMETLTKQMGRLNTVYGNMLTAMNVQS
ncbi:MAG: gliding motility protein GldL [Bacteroidales bacterium]|nr:gliding motility protein GldL [Bacteroidales bacterium]